MIKPRRVIITLELQTDAKIQLIKDLIKSALGDVSQIKQIQVNIIQPKK